MKNNSKNNEKKLVVLPLDENSKRISQILANDTARVILETLADKHLSATEIADRLDLALTTVHYNIKKLEEAGLISVVDTRASEKLKEVKVYGPEEKIIVIVPKTVKRSDALDMLKRILPLIFIAGIFALGIEYVGMDYLYPGGGDFVAMPNNLDVDGAKETATGVGAGGGEPTGDYKTENATDKEASEQTKVTIEDGEYYAPGAPSGVENVTAVQVPVPAEPAEETEKKVEPEGVEQNGAEALHEKPKESVRPQTGAYNPHIGLWFFLGSLLVIIIFFGVKFYRKK